MKDPPISLPIVTSVFSLSVKQEEDLPFMDPPESEIPPPVTGSPNVKPDILIRFKQEECVDMGNLSFTGACEELHESDDGFRNSNERQKTCDEQQREKWTPRDSPDHSADCEGGISKATLPKVEERAQRGKRPNRCIQHERNSIPCSKLAQSQSLSEGERPFQSADTWESFTTNSYFIEHQGMIECESKFTEKPNQTYGQHCYRSEKKGAYSEGSPNVKPDILIRFKQEECVDMGNLSFTGACEELHESDDGSRNNKEKQRICNGQQREDWKQREPSRDSHGPSGDCEGGSSRATVEETVPKEETPNTCTEHERYSKHCSKLAQSPSLSEGERPFQSSDTWESFTTNSYFIERQGIIECESKFTEKPNHIQVQQYRESEKKCAYSEGSPNVKPDILIRFKQEECVDMGNLSFTGACEELHESDDGFRNNSEKQRICHGQQREEWKQRGPSRDSHAPSADCRTMLLKVEERDRKRARPNRCPEHVRHSKFCSKLAQSPSLSEGERPFQSADSWESFTTNSYFIEHQGTSECESKFTEKPNQTYGQHCYRSEKKGAYSEGEKRTSRSTNLLPHRNLQGPSKPLNCTQCEQCFPCRAELEEHLNSHLGSGKKYTRKSNFTGKSKPHKGEKPFKCNECKKCFRYRSQLKIHQVRHTGEKPFKCSDCDKYFTSKGSLTKHAIVHSGEKPFKCSDCDKCFTHGSSLRTHKRTHTGEKPFKCSDCGKCFIENSSLKKHERIHTGEKPFKCSECDRCFSHVSNLRTHERTHTGEKPFKCSNCDKCFSQVSSLKKHERIHTGEKPFKCSECYKCFNQISNLRAHERIHLGVGRIGGWDGE
ncbi:zinc finger protein 665-like isoform X3 [Rhinatrema bivittatum]|nr:zinc finger protein 665-like isoform X3 [Rhinatrema bivittatum]